jgi:hypothetical protein
MITRRASILALVLLAGGSFAPVVAGTAPLQVTYYYLPG